MHILQYFLLLLVVATDVALILVYLLQLDGHQVRSHIDHQLPHVLGDTVSVNHLEHVHKVIAHYAPAKRQHQLAQLSGDIFATVQILSVIQEMYYFFDIVGNECLASV